MSIDDMRPIRLLFDTPYPISHFLVTQLCVATCGINPPKRGLAGCALICKLSVHEPLQDLPVSRCKGEVIYEVMIGIQEFDKSQVSGDVFRPVLPAKVLDIWKNLV
jgi:hypothetical protein